MDPAIAALHVKHDMRDFFQTERGHGYALAMLEMTVRELAVRMSLDIGDAGSFAKMSGLGKDAAACAEDAISRAVADVNPADRMSHQLRVAATYYVTSDMVRLTNEAARTRDDSPMHMDEVPHGVGFAYLETPIPIETGAQVVDRDTGELTPVVAKVRAIFWLSGGGASHVYAPDMDEMRPGLSVMLLTDKLDKDELYDGDVWELGPRLVYAGVTNAAYGRPLPEGLAARWTAAFFHLVETPLATRSEAAPDRATRRRALRRGDKVETVSVINLRTRPFKYEDHEPGGREYSHRFIVDGHWRNQPYGDGTIRRIYIAPFIKGPSDKPLVIKEKVYKWRR